ncbi:PREDICTED: acetylcholinesterase-like [Polistes dominula]|uniref:Acetylcholinesterase-like n=1 Tax=Polistes dominula TaxID=743375 RepID=A0ABM1HT73_POLDO|nr:PREDICTED: acetylcholinesterase-like [Polistes dominula]
MRGPCLILLIFIQRVVYICILLDRISFGHSQNTYARQGLGRVQPTVIIPNQGIVAGKEVTIGRGQKVIQYLGIPYAQPPTGQLRFSIPVTDPLPSWDGIRNASEYGPSCQQVSNRLKLHEKLYARLLPPDQPDPGMSEDCLFLNIFVPDAKPRPTEGWPVMVWFHSGDFNTGTPKIWDASIFVTKQKVVVVTVAYRLNILGFFTTTDGEAPGNYGMFDQIAALDWIKGNIERFEGSPTDVTIYGHSSGAICVGLHMMSPLSRGKFSKAIAMSGDAIGSVGSAQTELPIVDIIAEKFGCYRHPTTKLMECLRRVDVSILVEQASDIETWGPIVDAEINNSSEPFLPEHPKYILTGGNFNAVPLIVGYTKNEQALAYIESITTGESSDDGLLSEKKFETMIIEESTAAIASPEENSTCEMKPEMLSDAILFYYKPHPPNDDQALLRDKYLELQRDKNFASGLTLLAGELSKQERSYVYRFDYRPKTDFMVRDVPEWAGVPHMFELPFVWGIPLTTTVQWNPADKKMSEVMMMMLANFAKTSNPSLHNVKWNPYTINDPGILIIDRNIDMNEPNVIDYKAFAFWNEYYPKVVEEASNNCCNVTSSATRWKYHAEFFSIQLLILIVVITLYT